MRLFLISHLFWLTSGKRHLSGVTSVGNIVCWEDERRARANCCSNVLPVVQGQQRSSVPIASRRYKGSRAPNPSSRDSQTGVIPTLPLPYTTHSSPLNCA